MRSGERQQRVERVAVHGRHRPDLHEPRRVRASTPGRRRVTVPRGVRRERVRGLGERKPKRSAHSRNASRKPRGRLTSSSTSSSQSKPVGGMGGERGVEVPPLARAGPPAGRGAPRRRGGSARARAARRATLRAFSGRATPSTRTRRRGARRAARAQRRPPRERRERRARVARARRPSAVRPRQRPGAPGGVVRRVRGDRRGAPGRTSRATRPARERGEHDPVPAAAAHDVPEAARERAQLAATAAARRP